MVAVVIGIFAVMAMADFPQLVKDKKWREVVVLAGFYVFVLTLAVLQAAGVELPSPARWLQHFIADVLRLGYPKS